MSQLDGSNVPEELKGMLPERSDEAVVDPFVLDAIANADPPFRGDLREKAVKNLADRLRRRRSIDGLSERFAAEAAGTVADEVGTLLEGAIRDGMKENADSLFDVTRKRQNR